MGILRNRGNDDDDNVRRYQMREKLLSVGDDYWIEDDQGNRTYRVNGKALRARSTFKLEDSSGREIASIQERKLSVRDKMAVERDGHLLATVHKALVGIRDRFVVDLGEGADLKVQGNVVDHEYEIERDGDRVARISKRWFRVRDTYGVEVEQGQDVGLVLAITVALESMTEK